MRCNGYLLRYLRISYGSNGHESADIHGKLYKEPYKGEEEKKKKDCVLGVATVDARPISLFLWERANSTLKDSVSRI